jgi:hypothetical protein
MAEPDSERELTGPRGKLVAALQAFARYKVYPDSNSLDDRVVTIKRFRGL